jgi:signal transduction histidine kinase
MPQPPSQPPSNPPPLPASRPSLRRRLYSLLFQWFLLFLLVGSLVIYLSLDRFREQALEERLLLARTVAHYLDSSLDTTFQNLRQLPFQLPTLGEEAAGRLRSFRFQSMFRDAIFLLDERGRPLASDPPFAEPPRLEPLLAGEAVTPLLPAADGERRFLAVVQPFERDRRRHFLVAEMSPRGSTVSTFLQNLALDPELRVAVIDRHGVVIAASDHSKIFRVVSRAELLGSRIQSHRPFIGEDADCALCDEKEHRRGFLTVMVPLRFAPWGVIVQEEKATAFAALYTSQLGFLTTGVLLILMGLLLTHGLTRSVARPIQELSEQAERLRRGDLSQPITVTGDYEIRVLASTLDEARGRLASTLGELRALNESLEAQVASRTRGLEEQAAQRKVLVRRLLGAGEEERRRIARELHDEISQLLAVVQLSLDNVAPGSAEMDKARQLLTRTQKEVHRIIYDLRPSILDDLGLSAAVEWYAENYLKPRGVHVHLEVEEALALPDEVEIAAFRIYQEIVTNILRHAEAEDVSIELYTVEGRLILAVEDDGVGFVPEQKTEGVGLVGMRERAALVGGSLTLDSEPGFGTQVRLEIPLDQKPEVGRS